MAERWLLADLPERDRHEVLAASTRRRYERAQTVFHEGDPGNSLHLIERGHVAVRVSTAMGDIATLTVLGPGDTFGELALVTPGSRRSASVVALDAVETLALHRDAFDSLVARRPAIHGLLTQVLARQVNRLTNQLVEAYYESAETRIFRGLMRLCVVYSDGNCNSTTTVPIDQQTLATMTGTTRPTVNRVLADARAAGWLDLARGRVVVIDAAALERHAGL